MQNSINLPIIGIVQSPLSQKFGAPRQPNLVPLPATIKMLKPYDDIQAFYGITQFSHLWIIWQFHQNRTSKKHTEGFRPLVRPPRLGGNQKMGVFATRSMYRPANIGLSVVQLSKIEMTLQGVNLHIIGGDMIDGTPVIDIKPYIAYSDSLEHSVSGFANEKPKLKKIIVELVANEKLKSAVQINSLSKDDVKLIKELISQDPRPAYRQNEDNSEFVMRYKNFDIKFYQAQPDELIIKDVVEIQNNS